MFEVMVEKHFSAAHHLLNYEGKCANPHGHNYVVQVYVLCDELDEANIAIDFAVVKKYLGAIIDQLDHTDLNEFPDFKGESTSAEFVARYIYKRLKPDLPGLSKITIFETPTQSVTYYE